MNLLKTDATKSERDATAFLIEEGLLQGYGTHWGSRIFTELSDGQIEMWILPRNNLTNESQISEWEQSKYHKETLPQEPFFISFMKYEARTCIIARYLEETNVVYSEGNHVIYRYETYQDLIHDLSDCYKYDFKDGEWLENGKDLNGKRYLNAEGLSHGPYMTITAGVYGIEVRGQNLKQADISCVCGKGDMELQLTCIHESDEKMVFELKSPQMYRNMELKIRNTEWDTVIIEALSIQKLSDS